MLFLCKMLVYFAADFSRSMCSIHRLLQSVSGPCSNFNLNPKYSNFMQRPGGLGLCSFCCHGAAASEQPEGRGGPASGHGRVRRSRSESPARLDISLALALAVNPAHSARRPGPGLEPGLSRPEAPKVTAGP